MARKRYRNKTERLQILYNEKGQRRSVVPGGTVILEESHAKKFLRYFEPVE